MWLTLRSLRRSNEIWREIKLAPPSSFVIQNGVCKQLFGLQLQASRSSGNFDGFQFTFEMERTINKRIQASNAMFFSDTPELCLQDFYAFVARCMKDDVFTTVQPACCRSACCICFCFKSLDFPFGSSEKRIIWN